MRRALIVFAAVLAVPVLLAAAFGYDTFFNGRRMTYALLGRDGVVAACTPALTARLREAGFQPYDLEFGSTPDLAVATGVGKRLKGPFTFQDGAIGVRVDGIVACVVDGPRVTVDFRTSAAPVRAG